MNNLNQIEKQKQYELNELIQEIHTFEKELSDEINEDLINFSINKDVLWEKYEQLIWKEQELITIERMRYEEK
ncbi:MAG TPA: hypothetical protein IAA78_07825 [Candidatus Avamphibacillus intestinigallinarum]|nr:hypothetical protein [Candidatus Avamphibacillus intestinigallinarum]